MCHGGEGLGSPLNACFSKGAASDAQVENFSTQNVAALWEWQHQKGWLPFDASLCNSLETAWASGKTVYYVSVGEERYNINFVYMWQQNCSSHTTRQIRRRTLKEAPVWYWWSSDGFHRLGASVTCLVEAEYQQSLTEELQEQHEVIWTVEDGTACTINVAAMQVTEEATGQSYPLSRSLIKAVPSLSDAATKDTRCSTQQEQRDVVDASSGNGRSGTRAPGEGGLYSTKQTEPDTQVPKADSSLHLSVHGANVSLQVPQGGSVAVHLGAQGQQQPLQQSRQLGQASESSVFLSWGSTSCPCDRNGEMCCCCGRMCRCPYCCSVAKARCCCHCCGGGSCCGCHNGSPSKHPCSNERDATESKCLQCNLVQQNEDFVSVGTSAGNVHAASTAPAEDGPVTPPVSSSPTASGTCDSPQHQDEQPQQDDQQKTTTEGEQKRLLQQQIWELQQSQFLLRQDEQLTRQTHLEEQQEKLHHQQQELVHKLQLQQDHLLENQKELHDQQRQLVQQHAEQQQIFVQQAGELQQLREWAQKRETLETPGNNRDHQTSAETPNIEVNGEQAPLKGSGPPAQTGSPESRQTPTAAEFLSPVADDRTDDDGYTCI